MDRLIKLLVSVLVLTYISIPIKYVLAEGTEIENNNYEYIKSGSKEQRKEVISITNEELLLLSKLITGEARGESYEGQLAVAASCYKQS